MKKLALAFIIAGLSSCASLNSIITKTPIPVTPVKRDGGVPFNVAVADVTQAEIQKDKVWGLYDAKALAEIVVRPKIESNSGK